MGMVAIAGFGAGARERHAEQNKQGEKAECKPHSMRPRSDASAALQEIQGALKSARTMHKRSSGCNRAAARIVAKGAHSLCRAIKVYGKVLRRVPAPQAKARKAGAHAGRNAQRGRTRLVGCAVNGSSGQ